ncbi:hypothetical protein Ami103574_10900 [Aminipila butyrica]|uniref:Type ii secretion system (T2ss) protein f n=1 Tax=Aminipila butyrica TaxID=433296 RepID=A0A858BW24_9FIRM|nr:hypothetical protein [Aminipila butyrica]QIB69797.1 hypothetical protein Ami103574_10900 [Aminipila butyrica]
MNEEILNILIPMLLGMGGLLLFYILLENSLKKKVEQIKGFIEEKKKKVRLKRSQTKFDKHLKMLIQANGLNFTPDKLEGVILIIFIASMCLTVRVLLLGTAIFLSVGLAIMPYLLLRVRLEEMRAMSSREAEVLVNAFLIKYRAKQRNIEETLEAIIKEKSIKNTKPLLLKLLFKLQNTKNKAEIKAAVEVFVYSINTNWARLLGSNVYQATTLNIDVTLSLEDLLVQLREARRLWEKQKRDTAEPRRILWGIPILYFFFAYISWSKLGLSANELFYNQFASKQGVSFFMLIVIGFTLSLILVKLRFSRKFDC